MAVLGSVVHSVNNSSMIKLLGLIIIFDYPEVIQKLKNIKPFVKKKNYTEGYKHLTRVRMHTSGKSYFMFNIWLHVSSDYIAVN